MPAIRISSHQRRRRSSHALTPFSPAKPGFYGIARPVTFAPNVTPGTFVEPDYVSDSTTPEPSSPSSALFPPAEDPCLQSATRRRQPPGKRRSQGYIPRPPNAFMLFRADFVRQKHVPGSIETNHGSLSKIIGNCWRALPLEEKRVWEVKAKHAKAEHKARYPNYRFRPIHNKNKDKKKEKSQTTPEDERRCEEVAQLLLEGKKGDELAAAVRNLDRFRSETPATAPLYQHRRSSSVPLPNDYCQHFSNIALPSLAFMTNSRPSSPVSISRQNRMIYGHRRSSSACPLLINRSWTMPAQAMLQRDPSPLPDVDTSLFNPSWSNPGFSFPTVDPNSVSYSYSDIFSGIPPVQPLEHQTVLGPLDPSPLQIHTQQEMYVSPTVPCQNTTDLDMSWMSMDFNGMQPQAMSQSSTVYSGSPEPSENSLPVVHAPRPQQAIEAPAASVFGMFGASGTETQTYGVVGVDTSLGLDFSRQVQTYSTDMTSCGVTTNDGSIQSIHAGLDTYFSSQAFTNGMYDFNEIVAHE